MKKNQTKKILSVLLSAAVIAASVMTALAVFGEDAVEINETNFPDANFRQAVALYYDDDGDGVLTSDERSYSSMIVSGLLENLADELGVEEDTLTINDLTGIEYFDTLKTLRCSDIGELGTLDVSALKNLTTLDCSDDGLTSLDISKNKALKTIHCCSNEFTSLDFSANENLERIHCYSNLALKELNVSGLQQLTELRCDNCQLETLDVSTCTGLTTLYCSYNHIAELDLSGNTGLTADGRELTDYHIGNQSLEAPLYDKDGYFQASLAVNAKRVASTDLDTDDTAAYNGEAFFTDTIEKIYSGFTYYYDTGLENAEKMSVNVKVTEAAHSYRLSSFDKETGTAAIRCRICGEEYSVNFADCINARKGSENYCEYLDVVSDGIINAKDYAKLIRTIQ